MKCKSKVYKKMTDTNTGNIYLAEKIGLYLRKWQTKKLVEQAKTMIFKQYGIDESKYRAEVIWIENEVTYQIDFLKGYDNDTAVISECQIYIDDEWNIQQSYTTMGRGI